jgi:preprotein translocase subunit YajC
MNDIIIIIPVILIGFAWIWYQEKRREKKDKEELNKRLWRGY